MKSKYMNDAIIGGKNITASYTKNGELLRLMFDMPDYKQLIDYFDTGVKINDSCMIYLHQDQNNRYKQYYTEDTNVLHTEIENTYFELKIKQTDFVSLKNNVLVKRYIFENNNTIDLNVNFLIHSKLLTDYNNSVGSKIEQGVLTQFSHQFTMSIFSKSNVLSHQLNDTEENIESGVIQDKDYIGMSPDSSISYDVGLIKPGEKKELDIFLYVTNAENDNIECIMPQVASIRKMDVAREQASVEKYWKKYVKDHVNITLKEETSEYNKKYNKIYKRSILLFPLLINNNTGGISAAVEVDEEKEQSGRYAYCWPRDAVFVTKALDKLKMYKDTEKFYKVFCKNTQNRNGMWEQRFYTDGKLAPSWGYQIDETASVIYGIYEHYQEVKDVKFLKDTLKMCESAAKFLCLYIENIMDIHDKSDVVKNEIEMTYHTEGRNKLPVSYDLWEMEESVHLYSLASIYGAFTAMTSIYEIVDPEYQDNRLKLEAMNKLKTKMEKYQEEIKKYISKNMYDETTKCLYRNCKDKKTDISVLGVVVPFKLFGAKEKKVLNTVEKINMTIRTYTGGYLRFEGDSYRGGKDPWTIATLWMAMYYQANREKQKAKECIDFIVNSANEHGFLSEQVDNSTMSPSWVNGLAWAHAMFVLSL